ncbi:protoheme IX farnesyltransferase [Infirmifilum lucidum]|uniref:Protoheme IX farnesyltransferase n=1 Tax=Infirmifilum lucidum TaxID=2776706 RepID=A0A7L9FHT5_9CREN|nr:protoheme IX farnesyltransferase [Infirmifilum lucidum]QOJ79360.1 protoheme IX farnesyltransferase [Infirmifilum lucidum]
MREAFRLAADFFKIKQSLLLLWTGVFAFLVGANMRVDAVAFAFTVLSIFLTVIGTTGFNMVLDADIDSKMFRTRNRPIPSGRLDKKRGSLLSLAVLVPGLLLALMVNAWVFVAGVLGFLIDILLYTYLLKRRSPFSTVFGGFAGGMPALGGWAGATGSPGIPGILLLLLVAIWSNVHIWTLATYYVEDYKRAGVPMLPVVKGERAGVLGSLVALLLVAAVTTGIWAVGVLSLVGLVVSLAVLALPVSYLVKALRSGEYGKWSYKAFKTVNMFMGAVFLLMVLK